MSNAAFCGMCMEKKSENVAIYPKHIWENEQKLRQLSSHSRSHRCMYSSWLNPRLLCTPEAQVGAPDWTKQYISSLREQQGVASLCSSVLEVFLICSTIRNSWEYILSPLYHVWPSQPCYVNSWLAQFYSGYLQVCVKICFCLGRLHIARKRAQREVNYFYYLS